MVLFLFLFLFSCAGYQPQDQDLKWEKKYGVTKVKIEPTRMLGHLPFLVAESDKNLKSLMDSYSGVEIVEESKRAASLQLVIETENKKNKSITTSSRIKAQIDDSNGNTRPDIYIPATSIVRAKFHFFLTSVDKKEVYFNKSFDLSERFVRQNLFSNDSVINDTQNRGLTRKAMAKLSNKALSLFKQVVLDEF